MRYFYVIVQITSIAHNSFFVPRKPFVSVNVVVRSSFVLLCWTFFCISLVFVFIFSLAHSEKRRLNRNKKKNMTTKLLSCSCFLCHMFSFVFSFLLRGLYYFFFLPKTKLRMTELVFTDHRGDVHQKGSE